MKTFFGTTSVLFDLDGTLVDSAPDLGAAANTMLLSRGLQVLPLDVYRPMVGAGARGMLGVAFGIGVEHAGFDAMREEFFVNYARCLTQRTTMFDGVPELIAGLLRLDIRWGVVTNKSSRFALPLTASMPLFNSAATIICGDTLPLAKPHPEPLLEAARRLSVDPAQCVYVGDDERDVVAGLAAGMYTVVANYGYLGSGQDTKTWGAHASINSPLDLLQLLTIA